ncbi:hypothetical protein SAMN05421505_1406 [Sinosporangium album]|uniref:Uncharacterized protein n=1 Tax=Sinosporangium album TaxID=504805 RepID=A0A1G8IYI0_9ACTN|nr:hypothetical protein SAMN05421505_1406 [Sinosporangium album]
MTAALGDLRRVLRNADPLDKAAIYEIVAGFRH